VPSTPPNADTKYNAVAMSLHWLIAALIVTNIGIAWYFNTLNGAVKIPPIQLHKSIGITVLLLSVVRLSWRFLSPPPPLPASVTGWQRPVAPTFSSM
jgi:cytochrome b561